MIKLVFEMGIERIGTRIGKLKKNGKDDQTVVTCEDVFHGPI
jgi:hypothetical protein